MYSIRKEDGTELGYTETLRYIRIGQNGCYTDATSKNFVGIAYKGVAYNLPGHDEVDGETVFVHEFDGGEMLSEMETENERLEKMVQYVAESVDVSLDDFVKAGDPEEIIPEDSEEILPGEPEDLET